MKTEMTNVNGSFETDCAYSNLPTISMTNPDMRFTRGNGTIKYQGIQDHTIYAKILMHPARSTETIIA